MNTAVPEQDRAFAVWITGLPASGKSTLAAALKEHLARRGVDVAVLESDGLRQIFRPESSYSEEDRDTFYAQLVAVGALLVAHGVPVIFDATANRRAYRDRARAEFRRFIEVYVDCPLETCVRRDPKGIYQRASRGEASNVPGVQAPYEPPRAPEVIVHGAREAPENAAQRVMEALVERGHLPTPMSGNDAADGSSAGHPASGERS